MKLSAQLSTVFFATMLTSCFTLHKPAYLISALDEPHPQNAYNFTGTASVDYFLLFGGNKKNGLMAEARANLWQNLNGAQNLQIANVVVDEQKLTVFGIYTQHKVQINADFIPNEMFRDTAALETLPRSTYGYISGDRVQFDHMMPSGLKQITLIGEMNAPASKTVLLDLKQPKISYEASDQNYMVALGKISLLTITDVGLEQGNKVSFNPINRRGNYFEGHVVRTDGNYDVWVELTPEYAEKYYGENQPHGNRIVYVPAYRIRKL